MSRATAPFPFASLRKVDRPTARLARRLAAALASVPPPRGAAFDGRWADLLGGPVRVEPGLPAPVTARALRAAWDEVPSLASVWHHPALGAFVVALPRDLAFVLVTRALGPEAWTSPAAPWSEVAEGALSALAARVAVALTAPRTPPTLRAITDRPDDALAVLGDGPIGAWTLSLAGDALAGRMTLALALDRLPEPTAAPPRDLAPRFAEVAVPVRCVGARAMVAAAEVASLAVDDHLLLRGLRGSPALSGDVTLALGAHPPLRFDATLSDATRVAITAPLAPPWSPAMSDSPDVLAALAVEVTVELASQSVPLETVASWGVGAVVEFPQRLGETVVVRAGGREIARGELVDVDGQVGVRITSLR